jgi:hypothetical protein
MRASISFPATWWLLLLSHAASNNCTARARTSLSTQQSLQQGGQSNTLNLWYQIKLNLLMKMGLKLYVHVSDKY